MNKARRFVIPLAAIGLVFTFLTASPFFLKQFNRASQVVGKPKSSVRNSRSEEDNSRVYTSKVFNYSVTLPNEKWRFMRLDETQQFTKGDNVDLRLAYTDGLAYIWIATEITDYTPRGLRNFYVLGEKLVNTGFGIRSEREVQVGDVPGIELAYSLTDGKGITTLHTVTFLKYGNCGYGIMASATPEIFDEINRGYQALVRSFAILDKGRVQLVDRRVERPQNEIGPIKDVVGLVRRYGRSVVVVATHDELGHGLSVGSGFIVSPRGFIVTNYHVLADAKSITVQTAAGVTYKDVELIHLDKDRDFAVIKIPTTSAPSVQLGDSDKAQVGERLVVIGTPLGLFENTVSDGLVSGLRNGVIQISAPVSPGNSGGPVFNSKGEVIGVATLSATAGQNLNFCIPINWVKVYASPATYVAKSFDELKGTVQLATLEDVNTAVKAVIEYADGGVQGQDYSQAHDLYYRATSKIIEAVEDKANADSSFLQVKLILERGLRNAELVSSEQEKARVFRNAFVEILNLGT